MVQGLSPAFLRLDFAPQAFLLQGRQPNRRKSVGQIPGRDRPHPQIIVRKTAPYKAASPWSARFPQHIHCPVDELCAKSLRTGFSDRPHAPRSGSPNPGRHLAWHARCRRAGPYRVGKDVHTGKAHAFHKSQVVVKLAIGFTGKSDHQIGGHGQIRDGRARDRNQVRKLGGCIATRHTLQNGVRSALQGEMQMAAQARVIPKIKSLLKACAPIRTFVWLQTGGTRFRMGWRKQ